MVYLSQRALQGLKAYKYKPAGYTMLDELHTPLFNWAVTKLPMWLAPNLITLTGTMALVVSYCVSMYYTPDFDGDAPRWTYLLSAFAVVFYCHLDCLDGKQARRTKSSSPLGQLFDHGCDALSVNLLLANIACSMSLSCSWVHAVGNFGVMFTWILAQWEEYHTGIMLYGNSFYGVLECNYTLALVHVITFLVGPEMWRRPVTDFVPLPQLQSMTANEVGILLMITVGFYQACCNLYRVFTFDTAKLPPDERGHKQVGNGAAAVHFVILVAQLVLGTILLWKPTQDIPGLCRIQNATFGIGYALTASRLIVSHMAKEPFQPSLLSIVALAAAAFNATLRLVDPLLLAAALCAVILGKYLHYVLVVISQICDFLGIQCLRIPVVVPE